MYYKNIQYQIIMTIRQLLLLATAKLNQARIKTAETEAEMLLSFVLKKDKTFLFTHPKYKLNDKQETQFKKLINKRSQRYPLAYLINQQPFFNLNLYVDKHVLVPRPETEELVELALELIKKYKLKTVADIGTGSGAIALTLKKQMPHLTVYATDISKAALKVAQKNARRLKLHINFKQGNLLLPLAGKKIDLIVANLPYLAPSYFHHGAKEIKYEPKVALLAKNKGLEYYQNAIKQLKTLKKQPIFALFELDPRNIFIFKKWLISNQGINASNIKINKDLSKKSRFLTIKFE